MKKPFSSFWRKLTNDLFSQFRFYRKKVGGTWYRVIDQSSMGGHVGPEIYWTKEKPEEDPTGVKFIDWTEFHD